ncbi:MAG: RdgB/HAM1 family non-canonical purine NTP pyrophosphatase [Chloroflexi bacterium]|nr:RdgB/HAM1 family non-canonical purine NTP pyrophosphatase [Chloroflexota bacterium]
MKLLLIATRNPGKFREYQELLASLDLTLTSLDREKIYLEVEEVGRNYSENAALKSRAYARLSGILTVADDSGLEVDALGGEPGVYSSRYAENDAERIERLLSRMRDLPWESRAARFRCVIALATPQGQTWTAEGTCEGFIALAPSGEQGFGYDPVFYLSEQKKTMAELPLEVKNQISHRARAAQAIHPVLVQLARGR